MTDAFAQHFDALWLSGSWRKYGKDLARKRFKASVKSEKDWTDIQAARDAYSQHCMENRWYTPVLGSVWFGKLKGWRDWIPDERETELLVDESSLFFQDGRNNHYCDMCIPAHMWECTDELCTLGEKAICKDALNAHKSRVEAMRAK